MKGQHMRVGIATAHGGFNLKEELVRQLSEAGHEVVEFHSVLKGLERAPNGVRA